MALFVLLRHGQSQWNLENRFTGWKDVGLSPLGITEAKEAGKQLANIHFDIVFCSPLKRALQTADYVLDLNRYINQEDYSKIEDALRERDYGDLTGLNKAETIKKYGKDQVHTWRRSYDIPPPGGESLKDVADRVGPCFQNNIRPFLEQGKDTLLIAHGNTIRALLLVAGVHSQTEIMHVEVPTGTPLFYKWQDSKLQQLSDKKKKTTTAKN